jgi:small subunit ribosomal protein S1
VAGIRRGHPQGSTIEGEIKSITEFGLFVGLDNEIDGMVHLSDLSWDKQGDQAVADYKKGDMVKAKVLDIDVEKERISLGIKQLSGDPMDKVGPIKKGDIVTCTVTEVNDGGIEVSLADGVKAFIRRSDLARDRADQRPSASASATRSTPSSPASTRPAARSRSPSRRAKWPRRKEAVAQYGSSDSGASLGDILGAALKKRKPEPRTTTRTARSDRTPQSGKNAVSSVTSR